jgi:hypothetical protein
MNKIVKIIVIFLIIDAVAAGGYFLYQAMNRDKPDSEEEQVPWVEINAGYYPQDYIEEFIKNDSAAKGLLPVHIKNYDQDKKILRKFVGTQFARPTESQLRMMYPGIEDWQLVDLKYETGNEREITQTILYIYLDGNWRVGDRGRLENRD